MELDRDNLGAARKNMSSAALTSSMRPEFSKMADYLEFSGLIYLRYRPREYPRYIDLCRQEIFNCLIEMYANMFLSMWQYFRPLMKCFDIANSGYATLQTYAAGVYISHWFHDLYAYNCRLIKKLHIVPNDQYFDDHTVAFSTEYDGYLAALNAAIRPTHIQLTMEDTLYIPVISRNVNWETDNPFNITNFVLNEPCFHGLLHIMKEIKQWKIVTLTDDPLGKPSWLFDWHSDGCAYTWFPKEGNFTREDVLLAYILGQGCCQKLGPQDVDDWQIFPGGIQPAELVVENYDRLTQRRFFGATEVRTIDTDSWEIPSLNTLSRAHAGKRLAPEPASAATGQTPEEATPSEAMQTAEVQHVRVARYKIIDWTYYAKVVQNTNAETRNRALRMAIFN